MLAYTDIGHDASILKPGGSELWWWKGGVVRHKPKNWNEINHHQMFNKMPDVPRAYGRIDHKKRLISMIGDQFHPAYDKAKLRLQGELPEYRLEEFDSDSVKVSSQSQQSFTASGLHYTDDPGWPAWIHGETGKRHPLALKNGACDDHHSFAKRTWGLSAEAAIRKGHIRCIGSGFEGTAASLLKHRAQVASNITNALRERQISLIDAIHGKQTHSYEIKNPTDHAKMWSEIVQRHGVQSFASSADSGDDRSPRNWIDYDSGKTHSLKEDEEHEPAALRLWNLTAYEALAHGHVRLNTDSIQGTRVGLLKNRTAIAAAIKDRAPQPGGAVFVDVHNSKHSFELERPSHHAKMWEVLEGLQPSDSSARQVAHRFASSSDYKSIGHGDEAQDSDLWWIKDSEIGFAPCYRPGLYRTVHHVDILKPSDWTARGRVDHAKKKISLQKACLLPSDLTAPDVRSAKEQLTKWWPKYKLEEFAASDADAPHSLLSQSADQMSKRAWRLKTDDAHQLAAMAHYRAARAHKYQSQYYVGQKGPDLNRCESYHKALEENHLDRADWHRAAMNRKTFEMKEFSTTAEINDNYYKIGHRGSNFEIWWHKPGTGILKSRRPYHPNSGEEAWGRIDHDQKKISYSYYPREGNETLHRALKSQLQGEHPGYELHEFSSDPGLDYAPLEHGASWLDNDTGKFHPIKWQHHDEKAQELWGKSSTEALDHGHVRLMHSLGAAAYSIDGKRESLLKHEEKLRPVLTRALKNGSSVSIDTMQPKGKGYFVVTNGSDHAAVWERLKGGQHFSAGVNLSVMATRKTQAAHTLVDHKNACAMHMSAMQKFARRAGTQMDAEISQLASYHWNMAQAHKRLIKDIEDETF